MTLPQIISAEQEKARKLLEEYMCANLNDGEALDVGHPMVSLSYVVDILSEYQDAVIYASMLAAVRGAKEAVVPNRKPIVKFMHQYTQGFRDCSDAVSAAFKSFIG